MAGPLLPQLHPLLVEKKRSFFPESFGVNGRVRADCVSFFRVNVRKKADKANLRQVGLQHVLFHSSHRLLLTPKRARIDAPSPVACLPFPPSFPHSFLFARTPGPHFAEHDVSDPSSRLHGPSPVTVADVLDWHSSLHLAP